MDHFPPAQSLRQEIGPLLEDVFAAIPRRAEEARAAAGDEGDVEGVDLPLLGAFEVRAADGRDAVALGVRVAAEWEVGRAREQATELGAHLALDGAAADGEVAQLGVVRAGVALLDVCEQPSRLVDRAQEALWRRLVRRAQRHERAERRSFRLVELAQVGARNPAADAVRDEVDLAAGVPARRNQKESRRNGKDPEGNQEVLVAGVRPALQARKRLIERLIVERQRNVRAELSRPVPARGIPEGLRDSGALARHGARPVRGGVASASSRERAVRGQRRIAEDGLCELWKGGCKRRFRGSTLEW